MRSIAELEFETPEVVELLQQLIRNRCVNDGSRESGGEIRSSDTLQTYLEGAGIDVETFDAAPGRRSLVARIEGLDPDAPSLCLMGHTDVVPVNETGWREDPFGGELIGEEVWGRGAVDMLNLTASMAVAMRTIARSNAAPRGDLIFFGVADEEAAGRFGAQWMIEEHWDAIRCDYVLTENGGLVSNTSLGQHVTMNVAEKGFAWRRLVVSGTPGHGSMPFGADNAIVKAAEVVRRLAAYNPPARLDELWERRVAALDFDEEIQEAMLDPDRALDAISALRSRGAKAHLHACTHTTFSPNVMHGGVKSNVIPDRAVIDVDIRTVPGETRESVQAHIDAALGELASEVAVTSMGDAPATRSPIGTPMWSALQTAARARYPEAELLPAMIVGLTDARFFRQKGTVAYGAGLLSENISGSDFSSRFHGHNERIDVASLYLSTDFWLNVIAAMDGAS